MTKVTARTTTAIEAALASCRTESTRRTYLNALKAVARLMGAEDAYEVAWHDVSQESVDRVRTALIERNSPRYTNTCLCAMKKVLAMCHQRGLTSEHLKLPPVRGVHPPRGRHPSPVEIVRLLAACGRDNAPSGRRDGAMLSLQTAGLRRGEIVRLDMADYDERLAELYIPRFRGNPIRLAHETATTLNAWCALRGALAGPIFLAINKAGRIRPGQRLSTEAVYGVLVKRRKQAKVIHCCCEDLRRTRRPLKRPLVRPNGGLPDDP